MPAGERKSFDIDGITRRGIPPVEVKALLVERMELSLRMESIRVHPR
jgi:hypothetical protein